MKAKKFGVLAAGLLCMSVLGGVIAYQSANGKGVFFSKGNATAHQENRSMTITAAEIEAAIGAGTSGNFTAGGLEWHVDNASVSGGVVTISGGVLYNVTFAGATTTVDGWRGTGFTSAAIYNYDSKTGANCTFKDGSDQGVGSYAMGAVTADPFNVSFASATDAVKRLHFAFGAGDGTSFTSIQIGYGCGEAAPEVELGENVTLEAGDNKVITATPSFASGTQTYAFASSNDSYVTVEQIESGNTARITGVAVGSATITVTMTDGGQNYVDTITVTVTNPRKNLITLVNGKNPVFRPDNASVLPGELAYFAEGASTFAVNDGVITVEVANQNNFWSTQLFFNDAYKSATARYLVKFVLNSPAAGSVQLDGVKYSVVAGNNNMEFEGTFGGCCLEFVFGAWDGNVIMSAGTYTISNLSIKDLSREHFDITFSADGNNTIVDGCVGQKVGAAPADPTKEDYVFMSWQVAGEDIDLNTYVFNGPTTVTARFEEAALVNQHTVTVKDGENTVGTFVVNDGNTVDLSGVPGVWAHSASYFTDSGCTEPFNASTPITDDLTIYRAVGLTLPETYNEYAWEYSGSLVGGEIVMSFKGGALADAWKGQINFVNVPVGEAGKTYRITFEYSSDVEVGYKLCRNRDNYAVYDSDTFLVGNDLTTSIQFDGGIDSVNKVTIEVGALAVGTYHLTIKSITLSLVE